MIQSCDTMIGPFMYYLAHLYSEPILWPRVFAGIVGVLRVYVATLFELV